MSFNMSYSSAKALVAFTVILSFAGHVQTVNADIVPGQSSVEFEFGGQAYSIRRGQSGDANLPRNYSQTTRKCPEHCIEPGSAAQGVATLSELEVFGFMQTRVNAGTGLLIDARLPDEFAQGSIPGAISVPAATLVANNPYREDLLLALGATGSIGDMDFSSAFDLMVFDDGPWSPTARNAIQLLLEAGYPAQKVFYYRGGLQLWHIFGLTVTK